MGHGHDDMNSPTDWLAPHRMSLEKLVKRQPTEELALALLVGILIDRQENKHRRYCVAELLKEHDHNVVIDSVLWGPRGLIRARFEYLAHEVSHEVWIPKPPPLAQLR